MYHNKAAFISAYLQKFQSLHGKGVDEGSTRERYEALAGLVRDLIAQKWARTNKQYLERGVKQVYYFSIEYLQGRILTTNLLNLDLLETCTEGLEELGINLSDLTEQEPEAGLGSGGLGFSGPGTRASDVDDHHFRRLRGTNAGRILHIADVQRFTQLQAADVDVDRLGKLVGKAGDFQRVDVLLDDAAGLDSRCLAHQMRGNVRGDLGLAVNGQEIRVQRRAGKRIMLDRLQEREAGAFALDLQVHHDVFRAAVCDHFGEGLGVHLEVHVVGAASVNHGGQPAFAAHLFEEAGAGARAGCGFEVGFLGHDAVDVGVRNS